MEQQQPGAQSERADHFSHDARRHEDLERTTPDQVDSGTADENGERDHSAQPARRRFDPGDVGHESCRPEGHRRHRDDQRPHVYPARQPPVGGAEQAA